MTYFDSFTQTCDVVQTLIQLIKACGHNVCVQVSVFCVKSVENLDLEKKLYCIALWLGSGIP